MSCFYLLQLCNYNCKFSFVRKDNYATFSKKKTFLTDNCKLAIIIIIIIIIFGVASEIIISRHGFVMRVSS